MENNRVLLVIAGPTAVGKTTLAIALASRFKTEILSADSRQCYRELNIGVAKPSAEELLMVPHHFIHSHSITSPFDAAQYEQFGLETLEGIFADKRMAIMVGGTGLYIQAVCAGVDEMPAIPAVIRAEVRKGYEESGLEWLTAQIRLLDPVYYASGEIKNPHRMIRALEFVRATGQSIRNFQRGKPKARPFKIIKIGLELPREVLNARIDQRVDEMMAAGLLAEVEALRPYKHLQALQTVGYRELFDYLDGLSSLDAAVELIKRHTRQYAKRQMTWFKKDPEFNWFNPHQTSEIEALIAIIS